MAGATATAQAYYRAIGDRDGCPAALADLVGAAFGDDAYRTVELEEGHVQPSDPDDPTTATADSSRVGTLDEAEVGLDLTLAYHDDRWHVVGVSV